jgi:hypothetical protein
VRFFSKGGGVEKETRLGAFKSRGKRKNTFVEKERRSRKKLIRVKAKTRKKIHR